MYKKRQGTAKQQEECWTALLSAAHSCKSQGVHLSLAPGNCALLRGQLLPLLLQSLARPPQLRIVLLRGGLRQIFPMNDCLEPNNEGKAL